MKKLGRKALALSLTVVMGTSMLLTGCGSGSSDGKDGSVDSPKDLGVTTGLNADTKGDISIMVWSGDGKYYEDIGNPDSKAGKKLSDAKNITASNVAQVYAVAQKFHEAYPNIKINLWSKSGDPDQYNTATWEEEMENFKAKYGKYPDIWASTDVTSDVKKGLVADLSVYKDDETYKSYNKSLMDKLNYYGFQAGIPSYTIPWGVWVNKSLAEDNNISVPDPDWTIDEFTRFVTKADDKTFWGIKAIPGTIINIGTEAIARNITKENKVDLNNEEVKSLLSYIPKWSDHTIDSAEGSGALTKEIVQESKGYTWYYFTNNRTLVNTTDPWFLTAGADKSAKDSDAYIDAADWDYYPFPSTKYTENSVKIVMDPMCIHNYAQDDGNTEWSKAETQKRDVAYTFASFWTASTVAKKAIYAQKFSENGEMKLAAGDSFPVVTGKAYDEQMDLWNSIDAHKLYKDKAGFQEVLKIWKEGKNTVVDYGDTCEKCWTKSVTENGEKKDTLYEWNHNGDEQVVGAWPGDKDWADNVKAKLSDWNSTINKRIDNAQTQLKDALKKYYNIEAK